MSQPNIQFRHNCGNNHRRLIAKVVNGKLEFQCDGCGHKYYWDAAFMRLLLNAMLSNTDFMFVFD